MKGWEYVRQKEREKEGDFPLLLFYPTRGPFPSTEEEGEEKAAPTRLLSRKG